MEVSRRCPMLNLTFGTAYQAVGHRDRGRGKGGGRAQEERRLMAHLLSQILKANHASFLIEVLGNRVILFQTQIWPFLYLFFFSPYKTLNPMRLVLYFHLSVLRQLSFWPRYKTKSYGHYFCVMPGSNELGLSRVFWRPVIYNSTETWLQDRKVLWQPVLSLCCRTKEIFTMIDKACHSQTLNFKATQQGYEGLVSKQSELIRKTFLCSDKVTTAWAAERHSGWECAVVCQVLKRYLPRVIWSWQSYRAVPVNDQVLILSYWPVAQRRIVQASFVDSYNKIKFFRNWFVETICDFCLIVYICIIL